ncbi:MAG: (Fe-S)-binding protein [Candidatus Eremiobacteraeota bacterium]|nr:(Fe-S)-binding protein [Candidatus Eremiobacteraeota bacterium]
MIDTPRRFRGSDVPPASIYDQCVRCGLCLPTCPTYLETMTETSGPRGRISLIKAVGEGELDLAAPGFVHQMSECLDCRACEAVCPSGVRYGRLVENARAQIQRDRAPTDSPSTRAVRWFALRVLFSDLRWMRFAASLLRAYQRSGLRAIARKSGLLRLLRLDHTEAMAPEVSATFFSARGQRFAAETSKNVTIFFHAGCVMQVAFAAVHEASVRVLTRAGCDVIVPEAQGCCGAIALHAGEPDLSRTLARRNIAAFERSDARYYIVNAAGCGSALKEYPELFEGDNDWHGRAVAFSDCVKDITEFLDAIGIDERLGRIDATVTYQEPCHLVHAQRISAAPRRLLRKIPGLHLREMAESSVCCGSAGVYNLTQPAMSSRLQERKIRNALDACADIVVTANPGCAMQVTSGLRAAGSTLPVKHIVELLDDSYRAYAGEG